MLLRCPQSLCTSVLPPHQPKLNQVLEFRPDSTCLETWKSPDVMGLVRCRTVAAMHCLEQLGWDWGWCGLAGAGWAGRGWPQVARLSGAGRGWPAGCESAGMPPQPAALKAAAAAPRPTLQHPRDVYLFASDVGLGQRAMLAARGGAILFRTVSLRRCTWQQVAVTEWQEGHTPQSCATSSIEPATRDKHTVPLADLAMPFRPAAAVQAVCKAVVYWDKAVLFPSRSAAVRSCRAAAGSSSSSSRERVHVPGRLDAAAQQLMSWSHGPTGLPCPTSAS